LFFLALLAFIMWSCSFGVRGRVLLSCINILIVVFLGSSGVHGCCSLGVY
jgi:hypothetical protein